MWFIYIKKINAILTQTQASMIIVSQTRFDNSGFTPVLSSTACRVIRFMRCGEIFIKQKYLLDKNLNRVLDEDHYNIRGAMLEFTTNKSKIIKSETSMEAVFTFFKGL